MSYSPKSKDSFEFGKAVLTGDFYLGSAAWFREMGFAPGCKAGHAESDRRQCVAISRNTGHRCRQWGIGGAAFCRYHRNRRSSSSNRSRNITRYMKYSKYLGQALGERIQKLQEDPKPSESLRDELDLMRALACDALIMYQMSDEIEDPLKQDQARAVASEYVREALKEVSQMALAMVRVERESQHAADMVFLTNVAKQLTDTVSKVLTDHRHHLTVDPEVIALELQDKVHAIVIDPESQGTRITPDEEVLEMDATIPALPPPESRNGDLQNGEASQ